VLRRVKNSKAIKLCVLSKKRSLGRQRQRREGNFIIMEKNYITVLFNFKAQEPHPRLDSLVAISAFGILLTEAKSVN
jgi:hypothetical protein